MKLPSISKKSSVFSLPSSVSRRRQTAAGFTLIEVMMVVLVILMLSGMLFKLGTIIKGRSEKAKALADLANIEHALNEYFAEYGIYPPVQNTGYDYERFDLQSPVMQDPNFTNYVDAYDYGLYSHLYEREPPAVPNPNNPGWNPDTERDLEAKARWAPYLTDVGQGGHLIPVSNNIGSVILVYSNGYSTIKDPWGNEYDYKCPPPFLSYRLVSPGLE